MANTLTWWNQGEVLEALLRPAQEGVAFFIAFVLLVKVLAKRQRGPKAIDLGRVINDQVGRDAWIDPTRIFARPVHSSAHGGEIDDRRYTGIIMQQHACWLKWNFECGN